MRHRLAAAWVVLAVLAGGGGVAAAAGPTPKQQCAAAHELSRLGRDTDAQALYLQLVNEGYKCKGTTAALHPGWPWRVTQFVSAWWSFALYAALVAGVVFAFFTRFRPIRGGLRRTPIVGAFFEPRVAVATFDSSASGTLTIGTAATALVNNALRRFAGPSLSSVNHISVSTGSESASTTVAKLGDLGPQFKAVAAVMAFLGRVISSPVYQLTGTLQPDDGQGMGLTLTLDRRSRAVDATTMRVKPRPPKKKDDTTEVVAALEGLSQLAAAWVDYATRKDELPNDFEYSTSPKSYAQLRLGILQGLQGEFDLAEASYSAALDEDPGNVGALVNLAELLRRSHGGRRARPEAAATVIEAAYLEMHQNPERRLTFIWYQLQYNRIALHLNWAAELGHAVDRQAQNAQRRSFRNASVKTLRRLGYPSARWLWWWHPPWPARQPLRVLVRRYGVRSALLRWHRPPSRGFGRFLFENAEPNAVLFELWEIQPNRRGADPKLPRVRWRSRRRLQGRLDAISTISGRNARYREARTIVKYFVEGRRPLSYRTRYNLACYLASRRHAGEPLKRQALGQLKAALEDAPPYETARLAAMVRTDPTLTPLRASQKDRQRLEEVLSPFLGTSRAGEIVQKL